MPTVPAWLKPDFFWPLHLVSAEGRNPLPSQCLLCTSGTRQGGSTQCQCSPQVSMASSLVICDRRLPLQRSWSRDCSSSAFNTLHGGILKMFSKSVLLAGGLGCCTLSCEVSVIGVRTSVTCDVPERCTLPELLVCQPFMFC